MSAFEAEMLAQDESDALVWYRRTVSRRAVRGEVASEWGRARWRIRAQRSHMREATEFDCDHEVWIDEEDDSGVHRKGQCYYVEEGWWFDCDPDHPDAVAVWRVTERGPWRLLKLGRWELFLSPYVAFHVDYEGDWGLRRGGGATWDLALGRFSFRLLRRMRLHA